MLQARLAGLGAVRAAERRRLEGLSGVQPGRLAQGPDEKNGARGRAAGIVAMSIHPSRWAPLGGEGCPAAAYVGIPAAVKLAADRR